MKIQKYLCHPETIQKCLNIVRTYQCKQIFLYIYFPNIFSELAGIVQIIKSPLTTMLIKYQKVLTNRNCLNFSMFLQGANQWIGLNLNEPAKNINKMNYVPEVQNLRKEVHGFNTDSF